MFLGRTVSGVRKTQYLSAHIITVELIRTKDLCGLREFPIIWIFIKRLFWVVMAFLQIFLTFSLIKNYLNKSEWVPVLTK